MRLLLVIFLLGACAPRPGYQIVPPSDAGRIYPVFFAASRSEDETGPFGFSRSEIVQYGQVDVSIPPDHQIGKIEVAAKSNPEKTFALVGQSAFSDPQAFRNSLRKALRSSAQGEVVIFVHGYNTTYPEGLFRTAQIVHDFGFKAVAVHYSWPSRGNPMGYAYDRDSALFARDGLERLIADVRAAGARDVLIVAHSLGSHLTMETLRQIEIAGRGQARRQVDAVVLISPDINIDVFRSQAARIGRLPDPFFIFVSKRDRALALSARLTGERNRLGNVQSIERVADLDITVLDVTDFKGDAMNHFTVASSPTLIAMLANLPDVAALISGDQSGRVGLVRGAVLTLREATEVVLTPVSAIAP
ncbi:alpha/beta hydrolase [Actibacterium sp. XHP0104]|uniref:alpha/beta hydrolase n=1 Tax=Actibacterium sp. XHP0104 TaxID=2984335 RepID=UPI0021E70AAF|nr:alpha/beta fold hydrolase [Actibacterium sp. XHP0104]MCV2882114.1 alpha/beta fold hydrolase [Actibacterium sp. XHP0104]